MVAERLLCVASRGPREEAEGGQFLDGVGSVSSRRVCGLLSGMQRRIGVTGGGGRRGEGDRVQIVVRR